MDLQTLIEGRVFGDYARQSDEEYSILCPNPAHNDISLGSCSMNVAKGVFHCWSCGAGGRAQKALDWVGYTGKVELGEYVPPSYTPLQFIDDIVLVAWEAEPTAWVEAGIDREILSMYEIGYDSINERITVPIRDRRGNLVAISGRSLLSKEEMLEKERWLSQKRGKKVKIPRYKVYKHELGDYAPHGYQASKGRVLWGQHLFTGEEEFVIVTEGFKAAMWVVQSGYSNTIALMGVEFTEEQVGLLCSINKPIYLMLDRDAPGRKAAEKLAITLYSKGINVHYVPYQLELSPDDLSREEVRIAINEATPHIRSDYGNMATKTEKQPKTERKKGQRRAL